MCGPHCRGYYPQLEEKIDEPDQIVPQVERTKSLNYGVRVNVIKFIYLLMKLVVYW